MFHPNRLPERQTQYQRYEQQGCTDQRQEGPENHNFLDRAERPINGSETRDGLRLRSAENVPAFVATFRCVRIEVPARGAFRHCGNHDGPYVLLLLPRSVSV
jgi:hypothetical protein